MTARESPVREEVDRVLEWLYLQELRHSRMIWRIESDARLNPPWPYAGLWHDPARAVLIDFRGHPRLGTSDPPWLQADADDPTALELLCGVRLPILSEVLCDSDLTPVLAALGEIEPRASLDVYACAPGQLGDAALPYEPTRLTSRHRALVAEAGWRPGDFHNEIDEDRDGVRWAIIRDGRIVSRLLVQRVSRNVAEVADVHTRLDHRRRGYGAALLQNVVRRLHERGLTVTYSVHPSNEPSQKLAEAVGFGYRFNWRRVLVRRA